jgi:pteridine reductase
MLELKGKRALVTGAGRRIGAEIACALGRCGMRVAVHYQRSRTSAEAVAEQVREAGAEALLLQADLRDRGAARELVDRAAAALGGLDLLVLSAAGFDPAGLEQTEDARWDETLALNLGAPFAMAQRAAPLLRTSGGSVVFVTCVSRMAPYRGYSAYQVSKAALYQLMRLFAIDLAPLARANAVAPGSVLPPDDWEPERVAALAERIPLRRTGSARDVADAVVHLARSEWITGTEIVVDGGRSVG